MFVAYDKNQNRIYADNVPANTNCFCPACGEKLRYRNGSVNRAHFAHMKNSDCLMSKLDSDYNSEWHNRMKSYFPKEYLEIRFTDDETGELHIADVFLPDNKIVIEFQHSNISFEEFMSRTEFHINNGRRIIWVFDESSDNSKSGDYGHFRIEYSHDERYGLYKGCHYRWLRSTKRKSIINRGPHLAYYQSVYQVYVYTGKDGENVIRRIESLYNDVEDYVRMFYRTVSLSPQMNYEELFLGDEYWSKQEPYKTKLEEIAIQRVKDIAWEYSPERLKAIRQLNEIRKHNH